MLRSAHGAMQRGFLVHLAPPGESSCFLVMPCTRVDYGLSLIFRACMQGLYSHIQTAAVFSPPQTAVCLRKLSRKHRCSSFCPSLQTILQFSVAYLVCNMPLRPSDILRRQPHTSPYLTRCPMPCALCKLEQSLRVGNIGVLGCWFIGAVCGNWVESRFWQDI